MRIAQGLFIGLAALSQLCYSAVPAQVNSFGAVAVGGTASVATITFSLTGVSALPVTAIGGVDFTNSTLACNSNYTTCTSNVTFAPRSPGVKQDALILKTAGGTLITSAFLNGIGAAPLLRAFPAAINNLAGTAIAGHTDGAAASATFRNPQGIAVDLHGNVYVADSVNQVIRKITISTSIVSTVAGNGLAGYSGDGGAALNAMIDTPTGVALDAGGNLFIADQGNSLIRRVDAISGIITTVAGGGNSSANGVAATTAALSGPNAVVVDVAGNLYISDSFHNLVRKVTVATGLITTVAGGGTSSGADGYGDGDSATAAGLNNPNGLALDSAGNLYIADTGDCMIRRVTASTAVITAVAGTGASGYLGDGGLATSANLHSPTGIRIDAGGNLYIADAGANVIRFVNESSNIISTIAGNAAASHSGDGGVADSASLNSPTDVALDSAGDAIVADYGNNVIRKVVFVPPTLTFPSTNVDLTSGVVTVTVANLGNAGLTISTIALTAGFEQQSSGSAGCAVSSALSPGATCSLALAFVPTAAGSVTGTLSLGTTTPSTLTVPLAGTALTGTPVASVSPASLTFAGNAVGVSSAPQTITLRNTGTGTLSGLSVALSGLNAVDFTVTTTCQSSLAAGAACTASIVFKPLLSGSRTATLSFYDSVASSPQVVSLSGTGTGGPMPVLSTQTVQFGSQALATSSATQAVTLTNTGVGTLAISSVLLSGVNIADFAIAGTSCAATLASSASCAVTVTFTPTVLGSRTASLSFALTAANLIETVTLSGTGSAAVSTGGSGGSGGSSGGTSGGGTGSPVTPTGPCVTGLTPSSDTYALAGASGTIAIAAPAACSWTAAASVSWVIIANPAGTGPSTLQYTVAANPSPQPRTATITVGTQVTSITQIGTGLRFVAMTPCRVIDTRGPAGTFGGPVMAAATSRSFPIPSGACGIPATAQAYALNVTVVPDGALGFLNMWPSGLRQPLGSILNSDGRVKSNAAIIPAGANGAVAVYVSNQTHVIVDISGYFVSASVSSALSFYALTPCRVVDTRAANGALGSPFLPASQARNFPIQSSSCAIPSVAQAYSFNFTVVPKGKQLSYLSTWPAGQPQPYVSTLNDPTGTVVANAAIVQAGAGGGISVFATDDTDVIIDINGYFAAPQAGGLSLYNLTPCRALDTRANSGPPLNGSLSVNMLNLPQCGVIPAQASAFVLNATVVPQPMLGYLTLWPNGVGRPLVSTLNAFDGAVSSNLAIVPATDGVLDAFTSDPSHLILDLFCYFGP